MSNNNQCFIWRCAKCSCHFANIEKNDGVLKQEKKCPKCKSLNILTLSENEIKIHCKCGDSKISYMEGVNGDGIY